MTTILTEDQRRKILKACTRENVLPSAVPDIEDAVLAGRCKADK